LIPDIRVGVRFSAVVSSENPNERKCRLFSKDTDADIGLTDVIKHIINTGDARPIKQSLRRHPQDYLPIINDFVDFAYQRLPKA
jgi:hypothetical protein